jgi:hypothetical protein
MDCAIEWETSKVENRELSAELRPAPDFAFMEEFDRVLIRRGAEHAEGWGRILIAEGKVVVGDVQLETAHALRAFLDETVREANRLAVDTRVREREEQEAAAAAAAEREAARSAAEHEAAERDARLTDEFRGAA